ncbi:MAG: vWA domain-containing protein, partial [Planctomycetota bacterium]
IAGPSSFSGTQNEVRDFESWDDILRLRQSGEWQRSEVILDPIARFDAGHTKHSKRPHFLAPSSQELSTEDLSSDDVGLVAEMHSREVQSNDAPNMETNDGSVLLDADVELKAEETDTVDRKRKPMAMVASAVIHLVILLLLAGITITNHRPKDQIAMTATNSSEEATEVETIEIDTSELEASEFTETIPTTPTEMADYQVMPVSTDAIAMPTSDLVAPSLAKMMGDRGRSDSGGPRSLSKSSDKSMRFCGVEGGGNHFVYLVDSSGSMGDAFDSARSELLASIDLLSSKQRFYVVFFDAEPDFMRITNPGVDESRSVYATDANKEALRRWAMRISKDRGRAPYDPLRFALELRPDVIFLLSDGEFPEGIAELLAEENRVDNLFGDDGPVSIVHTIGYHSREGAAIMKRIADANDGQYRYVPRPE